MYRNDEPPPEPTYGDSEEEPHTRYRVRWSTEHAGGTLGGTFDTEEAATAFAEDWYTTMVALDPDPESAAEEYEYEVYEVDGAEDA